MATVKERGYRHWDGRLVERRFPWLPIARTGVRLAFRKKGFKFAFAAAFSPATVFLGLLYISERIEDFKALVRTNQNLLNVSPNYFKTFLTSGPFLFLLVLVLVFASAGLIAEDLKHSSLQLYFARPLKKRDYLIGKLAVIAFFVLIITALPWVLLVVFKLIFAGNFKFIAAYPWLPLSILGYAVLLTVFLGFYLLLMSASGRSTRYVTVLIFFVYYFSAVLALWIKGIFKTPYAFLVSIPANLQQAGAVLFGQKPPQPFSPVWSFLVLAGICVLSGIVLTLKVRSVEVIK
jgi:ABC-type transport system involved in multi-copper enzyme maturation permease subunit